MGNSHRVSEQQRHDRFDRSIPLILTIAPGDTVIFETTDALNDQFGPGAPREVLATLDFSVFQR